MRMIEKFETWASDASNLLHCKDTLLGDDDLLHSDSVMDALIKEHLDAI